MNKFYAHDVGITHRWLRQESCQAQKTVFLSTPHGLTGVNSSIINDLYFLPIFWALAIEPRISAVQDYSSKRHPHTYPQIWWTSFWRGDKGLPLHCKRICENP